MNEKLIDYLNETKPNLETIEVATRAFLSEITDDLTPSEMKHQMAEKATDKRELERLLLELETSPQDRLQACLLILSWAWENPDYRQKIQFAFKGVQSKLPAIELGLLALIAMYGMYLKTTGGKRSETRTIERASDGTFKETTKTIYEGPMAPLSMVAKLFGAGSGPESKDEND
jgi:hypothetical protein